MDFLGANPKLLDPVVSEIMTTPTAVPIRHPDYYFEDGSLVIQVENTLFNVFRSTFTRHSQVFKDVFSLPSKPGVWSRHVVEGSSDMHPVRFLGISTIDFERLLWILYPQTFGTHKPQTVEEWISVLHLATRWEFDDIRALAIREIERHPLSPANTISLSREFDICSPWTLKAYTELCERKESLTMQEASVLGLQIAARISQLRERLRKSAGRRGFLTPPGPVRGPMKRVPLPCDKSKMHTSDECCVIDLAGQRKTSQLRGALEKVLNLKLSDCSQLVAEEFGLLENSYGV